MPQSKEGPGCTPTVDGERLYVLGHGRRLGLPHRSRTARTSGGSDLQKDFGGIMPMWSYRESPLVDGDKVICTPGGAGRDHGGPRQGDRQADLEEQGARGPHRRPWLPRHVRGGLRLGHRHRLRRAAPVRAAHRDDARRGRGGRRQVPLAVRPARQPHRASTAPRRSTTTAWCSPPRPTARAAGW